MTQKGFLRKKIKRLILQLVLDGGAGSLSLRYILDNVLQCLTAYDTQKLSDERKVLCQLIRHNREERANNVATDPAVVNLRALHRYLDREIIYLSDLLRSVERVYKARSRKALR